MFKKLLVFSFIYLFFVPATFAIEEINSGDVLNIEQCIEIALRNSPQVNKAKAQVRYQKANLKDAKAVWTPAVGAGVNFNGSNSRVGSRSNTERYFGADVMISQLIYDFGKTNSSINIQKFNTIAAQFELDYVVLETILEVKEAYFGVLAARANQEVQIQNLEINERQYDMAKSYFDEGIKSRIDLVNAEVNLSNAKIDLLSAQDEYCDAMVRLNRSLYVTGVPNYSIAPIERFNLTKDTIPVAMVHEHNTFHNHEKLSEDENKEITLSGIIKENEIVKDHTLNNFDKSFEEVLEIAQENRPDLRSYIATKNAMEESLKYTKRQWYPELSVNGGYNYMRNDSSNTNTNSLSYGADLSIPTIRPLSVKYQIEAAGAQLDSTNEDLKLLYQTIYYDVQLALCETKILENQIPLIQERIRQAKENFELADGRYQEGIGNYIELQDARSEYLNSQQEYVNAVYNYSLARANLDFVMGVK